MLCSTSPGKYGERFHVHLAVSLSAVRVYSRAGQRSKRLARSKELITLAHRWTVGVETLGRESATILRRLIGDQPGEVPLD